ncbi:PMD domain-containing protein, partial [Cephalotus follicularis]
LLTHSIKGFQNPSPSSFHGPIDGTVLFDQDKHVSSAVWDGQERGALRCHEHTSKLGEWRLTLKQIELVEIAGFGYLRKIPAISLDNPLISALVERWRRETNTFHLTVGEMTVTLQDVALMLGLAIEGKAVIGITHTTCTLVCERLLGIAPDSNYASGGMVKLSWLKEFFSHCPEDATIEEIERHTRAYLLYLVGSTIFSTTTGNKVPVMYLPLFEDFEDTGKYAWGAAALAFLYRALGNASVKSQSTICGCLTLLQCWSYYHLNIGRPKLNRDPIHDHFPFVLRWKGKQSGPTTNRDVVFYRKALDSLKPCDVEWLPYKYMDSTVIPEDIKKTLILGRSRTMLICFDKAERHLPDRCLRQYGMLQWIPEDVKRWVRKSRGVDGGVDLSGKMESELNEWADRQLNIVDGDDGVEESEYMEWYLRITRKIVGRPISLSSEFQRTISGLREIAYLADTFSTKGLDAHQYESISRIRCIVQECMRDQVGVSVTTSTSPQTELGKRSRGKERVRRKSSGKRRRNNDPMDGYADSDDDRPQFCGPIVEVGQLRLRQVDSEDDNLPLYHAAGEDDIAELCTDNKIDGTQLCDASDEVDLTQLCDATNEVDHLPLSNVAIESIPQTPKAKVEAVPQTSQICDAPNEVNDSQRSVSINKVNNSNLSHLAGQSDPQTTEVALEVVSQSSLETAEDNAHLEDNGIEVLHSSLGTEAVAQLDDNGIEVIQSSVGTAEDVADPGDNGIVVPKSSPKIAEDVKQEDDSKVVVLQSFSRIAEDVKQEGDSKVVFPQKSPDTTEDATPQGDHNMAN